MTCFSLATRYVFVNILTYCAVGSGCCLTNATDAITDHAVCLATLCELAKQNGAEEKQTSCFLQLCRP